MSQLSSTPQKSCWWSAIFVILPNFIDIDYTVAEISQFDGFQNCRRLPPWILFFILKVLTVNEIKRPVLHHHAKLNGHRSIGCKDNCDFSIFITAIIRQVVKFSKFSYRRPDLRHRTKLRRNRSTSCGHITVFQVTGVRHLGFVSFVGHAFRPPIVLALSLKMLIYATKWKFREYNPLNGVITMGPTKGIHLRWNRRRLSAIPRKVTCSPRPLTLSQRHMDSICICITSLWSITATKLHILSFIKIR